MHDLQLISEKLEQATAILNEFEVDLWLIFVRETTLVPDPIMELIAGIDVTWQSAFLLSRDGKHTAIVGRFDAANLEGTPYRVLTYDQGISVPLLLAMEQLQPQQIALNYSESDASADGLSHGMFRTLQNLFKETSFEERFISAERLTAALRGRKTPTEIERVREAVEVTESLFHEVGLFAKPGMTQRQIAEFVHNRIAELGLEYAWPQKYNPIVTCGPHSAVGHTEPGDVVLEKGHTLHLDLGVKLNDYCSDLQRMWYVLNDGETEAPAEVQKAFNIVRNAIITGEKHLTPGTLGWQVDEVAREFIVDNGYPEYMHAFGHLLGRTAHDGATVLGPKWERYGTTVELPIETGNIFTLELHVVVENRGIMSLEEDVVVTENGVEYLSTPQTELRYIKS